MGDATASLVSESLSSTTAGTAVGPCKRVNVSLSGSWVGTVTLQRSIGGNWRDVASWTGNTESVVTVSTRQSRARLNFTRTSGTVVTVIEADDRMQPSGNDTGILSVTPGTGATNLGKAEDAAHADGDVGVMMLGVRNDSAVARSGTDGDYTPIAVDSAGRVFVSGGVASGAADAGNPLKIGGVYKTSPSSVTAGQRVDAIFSEKGSQSVLAAGLQLTLGDGQANTLSTGFVAYADPVNPTAAQFRLAVRPERFNGSTWDRDKKPSAVSRIVSAANNTNATSAKASAGDVFSINGYNAAAAVRYLKLYNKASAPTVGTDTPVLTLALAPTSAFNFTWANGLYFSTGIAYGIVTGSADSDTTAPTAADIVGLNVVYT